MNALAEYQNERLFFTQLDGEKFVASPGSILQFLTPSIRLFFIKSAIQTANCGFKIAEISTVCLMVRVKSGFELNLISKKKICGSSRLKLIRM